MTNETDPLKKPSIVEKIVSFVSSRDPISQLALGVLTGTTVCYGLMMAAPTPFIIWVLSLVNTTFFLLAIGLFAWHETIGQAKILNPLYNFLYRLTGKVEFKDLIVGKKKATVDETFIIDIGEENEHF